MATLVKLLKRGWNEMPVVIGSSALALFSLAVASCYAYQYSKEGNPYARYRTRFIVYRPDDPKVQFIKDKLIPEESKD